MKFGLSLVLNALFSTALAVTFWSGSSFTGQQARVDIRRGHCAHVDHVVPFAVVSVKAETSEQQCTGYKDVWCEEKWNDITYQGWSYIGMDQLKSVQCFGL